MNIGELIVRLGVKADTFTVRDFGKAIGDLPLSVAGAITSLTGLSLGFMSLTKNTLDISNSLGIFRSETGLSIDVLQRWQNVAKQAGMSGDSVQQSILGISQALAGFRTGRPDAGFAYAMSQLQVPWQGRSADEILMDVRRAVQGMDPADAASLIQGAHMPPDMMRLFSLSDKDFSRMWNQKPIIDEATMRSLQGFQEELGKLELTILKSFAKPLAELAPHMGEIAEALSVIAAGTLGWLGKGIAEDAELFNLVRKRGLMQTIEDFINGSLTPEALKAGVGLGGAAGITLTTNNHFHGIQDSAEMVKVADERQTRQFIEAMKNIGIE